MLHVRRPRRYCFPYSGEDGAYPSVKLTMDSSGNLYGSTTNTSSGTAFELSPVAGGHWTLTTLYYFAVAPPGISTGQRFPAEATAFGTVFQIAP